MDSVIKGFLGIFLILVMALTGYGLLSASVDAKNADSFAADCVKKIEASDFAEGVIAACRQDALAHGYQLTVDVVRGAGRQRASYAMLTLEYKYELPLTKNAQTHRIYADIR